MKKSLTIITLLTLFTGILSAQTFTLLPRISNVSGGNSGDKQAIVRMVNQSIDNQFMWKVIDFSLTPGWSLSFCDPAFCNPNVALDSMSPTPFTSNQGDTVIFSVDLFFNGHAGTGCAKVLVYSLGGPDNKDTITICGTAFATGLYEAKGVRPFSIYPNPAHNEITLNLETKINRNIEIYNVLGTLVKTVVTNGAGSISLEGLQSGMYFARTMDENNLYTGTFVKE